MNLVAFAALVLLAEPEGIRFVDVPWAEVLVQAKKEDKRVLIDFTTEWCGWCKVMDRETFSKEDVAAFVGKRYVSVRIDAEKGEGIELAKRFGVQAYPTVLVADAAGEEVDRILGFKKPEPFIAELEAIAGPGSFKALRDRVAANPEDFAACLELGLKYHDRSDFESAEKLYRTILEAEKSSPAEKTRAEGRIALVAFLKSRGKDIASLEAFYEKHKSSGEALEAARRLVFSYQRAGKHEKFIELGDYILAHGPERDDAQFLNSFAWFLAINDLQVEKALELARKAVKLSPDSAHILDTLAEACFRNGLLAEAVDTQKKAVALAPEAQREEFTRRLEAFEKALAEKPNGS